MAKVKFHEASKKEKYKFIGEFYETIFQLKSKKEVISFFMGFLTPGEVLMLSRRIQIAKLLIEGYNYEEIRSQLKVGFSTIQKTAQWLNSSDQKDNQWIRKILQKSTLKENGYSNNPLDKYPGHKLFKKIFS